MNWLDLLAGTVLIIAFLQGYRNGFIKALISFFSLLIGVVLAFQFAGFVAAQERCLRIRIPGRDPDQPVPRAVHAELDRCARRGDCVPAGTGRARDPRPRGAQPPEPPGPPGRFRAGAPATDASLPARRLRPPGRPGAAAGAAAGQARPVPGHGAGRVLVRGIAAPGGAEGDAGTLRGGAGR